LWGLPRKGREKEQGGKKNKKKRWRAQHLDMH